METERATQGVVRPLLELAYERKTLMFAVDVSRAYALAEALHRTRPGCARAAHGELPEPATHRVYCPLENIGGHPILRVMDARAATSSP
jgi:hypothetical protein